MTNQIVKPVTDLRPFLEREKNSGETAGRRARILGMGVVLALAVGSVASGQSYRVLKSFTGSDGRGPWGSLVSSGQMLYGTTRYGGDPGNGTVFKVTTNGSGYTIVHNFAGSDGWSPQGALVLSGEALYGATEGGGIGGDAGTVFKLNTDGSGFISLKQFIASEGRFLTGSLVLSDTTLCGTTQIGGTASCGTVFKIDADGSGFTVLHNFTGYPNDGYGPDGGLLSSATTLYGATPRGGSFGSGYGTIFKIEVDGSGYTLLKQFDGTNGAGPVGRLVLSGGTLYGTTEGGYSAEGNYGGGTVFRINLDGTGYTVLHHFSGPPTDGAVPYGGLALSGTTLYGVTTQGGSHGYSPGSHDYGYGTVFMINTDGSGYSVLKEFTGDDGAGPYAGLLLNGTTLYGTTASGGVSNNGVVFGLSLPIPSILTAPATQTAEAGGSVIFRVQTSYDPSLGYQWFFKRTNTLNGAAAGSSLHVADAQFSDAGVYTVVVTNVFGSVTSAPAMLSVIEPVERRIVPALTLMGQPGTSLNLDFATALEPAPLWTTFDNVLLSQAPQWYFDLSSPVPPQGFYRAWQSRAGPPPTLDMHMIPALTLTGNVVGNLRLDYINQFGPIDAWVTLDTVTLTNSPQLYFDTSSIGQPPRLWRIVPVP